MNPGESNSVAKTSSSSLSSDIYLGIDVGGTNVKVGLVDPSGQIMAKASTATPALKTPENIFAFAMKFAAETIDSKCIQTSQLAGVGLAVPGVLDTNAFALREVVNLPGWIDRPLLEILTQTSGLPSAVVNDANAAAYAEHALRELEQQSLALVTLGTGVGCGLVIEGNPYGGDHGCAGELGHIAVRFDDEALPCTCGSRGHLESYAGSAGVIARLQAAAEQASPGNVPAELLAETVSPRELAKFAESGNELCRRVIAETAQYVGQAIGMVGQVIDPAVVLLGGAMTFGGKNSQVGIEFLNQVRQTVRDTTLVQVGGNISIEFATLGNDAGTLGAALVAKQANVA